MVIFLYPFKFSGNSHPDLASKIADRMGVKLANCSLYHSSNRESRVDICESVRARDCYIIQSASGKELNNQIMELCIMVCFFLFTFY